MQQKQKTFRQQFSEARPSKVAFFWSLVAVVAVTMIVGFNWGGWTTEANAQSQADSAASDAVTQRLVPICVAQFTMDPDREQKLVELQEASTYQGRSIVTDQGWATMPGETEANRQVATACADVLREIDQ